MNVSEAVSSRQSIRAYEEKEVDLNLLKRLIEKASRAPSGGNLQPWHIHIVAGEAMKRLKNLMYKRVMENPKGEGTQYDIYPKEMSDEVKARTFEVGEILYSSLGIPRDDKMTRRMWFANNYQFFGAPVGLFCYVPVTHGPPQWSDCGMFLQTLMLLLREEGLDSCAQECWAAFYKTIDEFLKTPEDQMLFTGMAIGYRKADHPVNQIQIPRVPLENFCQFHTE